MEIKILFCNIVNQESLQTGLVAFDLFVADMDVSIFFMLVTPPPLVNKACDKHLFVNCAIICHDSFITLRCQLEVVTPAAKKNHREKKKFLQR